MVEGYTCRYVNHRGCSIDLSAGGVDAIMANLPSWGAEPVKVGGKVASMRRNEMEHEVPLIIVASDGDAGVALRNALHDVVSEDIDAGIAGRLYFNDWYVEGFVTSSTMGNWWQTRRAAQYELVFTASTPMWVRETEHIFREEDGGVGEYLDYPYDFAHDYGSVTQIYTVENENYSDSALLIRIYGVATNPRVTIGGNVYGVDATVGAGEYLEIDGHSKSVTLVRANGERENAFAGVVGEFHEGSGTYAFEKLPAGISEVSWSHGFNFDIVEFERRAEPRWS